MNNEITEDYVSFEIAQLLKEKGFDCLCKLYMQEGREEQHINYGRNSMIPSRIYIPTHTLAIKWIRENFEMNISPINNKAIGHGFNIIKNHIIIATKFTWNSYEEATEAALLYTLKNLIP